MTENAAVASSWVRICPESELEENWGEVALVDGQQYAIFQTFSSLGMSYFYLWFL